MDSKAFDNLRQFRGYNKLKKNALAMLSLARDPAAAQGEGGFWIRLTALHTLAAHGTFKLGTVRAIAHVGAAHGALNS